MSLHARIINLIERGRVPDTLVRAGIRHLCRRRLREQQRLAAALLADPAIAFANRMRGAEVAPVPQKANEQHYEVPASFFERVLGAHLKYSACYWPDDAMTLDDAEAASLHLTAQRAELRDGMEILELGCGWGSLSLWMAEHYPAAQVTSVSNSAPQRRFIMDRAAQRGLSNLRVITADMNDFDIDDQFDRIVSVEMFEHMRNYEVLLRRVASWLRPDGKVFIHIFCHRDLPYSFESRGPTDWMAEHFFTGGIMPSFNLLNHFAADLAVSKSWWLPGTHYQKTSEGWLQNLDLHRRVIEPVLAETYGEGQAQRWLQRWRVFFLACAELFGLENGTQWGIGHYLLEPVSQQAAAQQQDSAGVLTGATG